TGVQTCALPILLSLAWIFGGPLLMLLAIDRYRFLDGRTFTAAVVLYAVSIPLFFAIVPDRVFPTRTPLFARVMARAGWALCSCAMVIGALGLVNGLGTRLETRDVLCVAKRVTRQRDEHLRTHYLQELAWPGSKRSEEVPAPRRVYDATAPGSKVRLIIGKGRLGLEWLAGVDLPR